ncbi:hypothetical protein GGX14DRAFT_561591 [Mycena pura]|uniref:Uncharacterized protein n=1 Tax=Mycena pura TaxID=153505 RepID=A0AAD6YEJ4_9AGAR|nr:hypothetical protein GGX14DRAFT_561591 [Mycena pura]
MSRRLLCLCSQRPSVPASQCPSVIQQQQRPSVPASQPSASFSSLSVPACRSDHVDRRCALRQRAIITTPPLPVAATPQHSLDFLAPHAHSPPPFTPSERARVPTSKAVVLHVISLYFFFSCRIFSVPGDGDVAIRECGMWTRLSDTSLLLVHYDALRRRGVRARPDAAATGITGHRSTISGAPTLVTNTSCSRSAHPAAAPAAANPSAKRTSNVRSSVLASISISRHASALPTQLCAPYENGMNAAGFSTSPGRAADAPRPPPAARSQRSGSNASSEARLQTAASSPAFDSNFPAGMHTPTTKQEEAVDRFMPYPLGYDYATHPYHSQYRPMHHKCPSSQTTLPSINPRGRPQLSRTSLPQVTMRPEQFPLAPHLQEHHVRRKQRHSAFEAESDVYRAPHGVQTFTSRDSTSPTASRIGPSSVVEYDLRWPTRGQLYGDHHDNGESSPASEPRSATASVFSFENTLHSSESLEGALLPEPQLPSASIDHCLIAQSRVPPHFHRKLVMLSIDGGKPQYHSESFSGEDARQFAFHPPAMPIHATAADANVHVPQFDGVFGNSWVDAGRVTGHEAELACPSPVTPVSLRAGSVLTT